TNQGPVTDVGFAETNRDSGSWVVHQIATGGGGRVRRRVVAVLPWSEIAAQYQPDAMTGELVRLHDLHKADAAEAIQSLSEERRAELTAALDADRLADVLEELPEDEQVDIIRRLDTEDAVAVLDEMETDDEIDLLKQMTSVDREVLLAEMPEGEVTLLRSLLSYREDTAGGMMTPQAVILSPETSVAEGVARLRDAQLPPALMVRSFVTQAPTAAPTGEYLGTVTLPRLLKEPPTHRVGDCLETAIPTVAPSTPEPEVAKLLARYDLLAVPVLDAANRLVGVVTVDDVLVRLVEGQPG
ncbi:MAG: magnesium transporter MgtE N-terminal domain-containing protein, partial [Acidimicrobiales bacterium]